MRALLTISEASKQYGLKERTLRNWIYLGLLKRVKIRRRIYLRPETIEDFLQAQEGAA